MMELVSTPEEAVGSIHENAYNIKIKCLACSESKFIPYGQPVIRNRTLTIGKHSFPLRLVEMVTVRGRDENHRWEIRYKVDSMYFRQFLNDIALQELEDFDL